MTHSRYSFAKAPIGNNLDQDSSGEEAVQDMIRRTLEGIDIDDHDHVHDTFEDAGYGTDDSWDVTRRRWARNKGDNHTGTVSVVRRRRPVVNRGKALANLPGVPWPLGNQDDLDSQDGDDDNDDDEEMAALAAEQTRQRTVDYFRSKVSQIPKEYSVRRSASDAGSVSNSKLGSQVSPDSVFTFALASRAQRVRKSTTTSPTATATAAVADVTTTPSRSITQQESESPFASPLSRRGRRRERPDVCHIDLDSRLVQHVERARASVISSSSSNKSNSNSNAIPKYPPVE
jgi:hypothetical protein